MVTIAVNHFGLMVQDLGYSGMTIPTLTTIGFSSAAELFFLLSGYMVGLIYLKKPDFAGRLRSRTITIYKYNFVAFFASLVISSVFWEGLAPAVSADYTLRNLLEGTLLFAVLGQHPDLLGVLQMYVVLMILTPGFVYLLRRSTAAAVVLSVSVYSLAQIFPWFNLPGGSPEGDWQWNLNPFAWQLVYFLGLIAGEWKVHKRLSGWLSGSGWRAIAVICAFLIATIYHRLMLWDYVPRLPMEKETLAPARVIHVCLLIAMVFSAMTTFSSLMGSKLAGLICRLGQSTLLCFTVSIPVTYLAAGMWYNFGRTGTAYMVGIAFILAAVIGAAYSGFPRKHILRSVSY